MIGTILISILIGIAPMIVLQLISMNRKHHMGEFHFDPVALSP